jgi:shikimate kinase
MIRHVILLGLMGAGKTTVGRVLGASLGWPVHDSDPEILAATGRTARQLDTERGTAELHRLEARHLREAIAAPGPSVICAAASTIDDPDALTALVGEDLLLVWLRADPAVLARRTEPLPAERLRAGRTERLPAGRTERLRAGGSTAGHRRRLGPDPVAALTEQAAVRYPRFAALAPLIVDVERATPTDISATIEARLAAARSDAARPAAARSDAARRAAGQR